MSKSTKIYLVAVVLSVLLGSILFIFGIEDIARSGFKSFMALGFIAVAIIAFYGFVVGAIEVSQRPQLPRMFSILHTNKRNKPITVWVEPFACDYTLMPQETIEIKCVIYPHLYLHLADAEVYYVEATSDEDDVLYYLNINDFQVYKDGVEIKDGYNREHSITK